MKASKENKTDDECNLPNMHMGKWVRGIYVTSCNNSFPWEFQFLYSQKYHTSILQIVKSHKINSNGETELLESKNSHFHALLLAQQFPSATLTNTH